MANNGILNRINTIIYTSNVNDAFVLIFFYYMWVFWIFFFHSNFNKINDKVRLRSRPENIVFFICLVFSQFNSAVSNWVTLTPVQ